jgi:hypothetical protein
VFDRQKIDYALEEFGDFINGSGSGANPEWTDSARKVIASLQAFEEKLKSHHVPPAERDYDVVIAIYAICELQSFVTGDKSDVRNRKAARVYRDFLAAKIEQLRQLEQDLDG